MWLQTQQSEQGTQGSTGRVCFEVHAVNADNTVVGTPHYIAFEPHMLELDQDEKLVLECVAEVAADLYPCPEGCHFVAVREGGLHGLFSSDDRLMPLAS